jgi:hypothetical protein
MIDTKLDKYAEYGKLNKKLDPLMKLRHGIQLFHVSWSNFSDTLNKIAKTVHNNDNLLTDPYLTKQIELLLRNYFATISTINDTIENNFYQINKVFTCDNSLCKRQNRKVTYLLKPEYETFETIHQNILTSIHSPKYQIMKWSRSLRNKLLHGGSVWLHFISTLSVNKHVPKYQVFLMTDFYSIDTDKQFEKLDINKYYTDPTIFTMNAVANGYTTWSGYDQITLDEKRRDILMRSKFLNLTLQHPEPLENLYLLKNQDFVMAQYNEYKRKNLQEFSRYGLFDLSTLLNKIHHSFNTYYSGFYDLICKAENTNLKLIMDISDQIIKSPHNEIQFIRPDFSLKITKSNYLI